MSMPPVPAVEAVSVLMSVSIKLPLPMLAVPVVEIFRLSAKISTTPLFTEVMWPEETSVISPVPASIRPIGRAPTLVTKILPLSVVVSALNSVLAVTSSRFAAEPMPPASAFSVSVAATASAVPSAAVLDVIAPVASNVKLPVVVTVFTPPMKAMFCVVPVVARVTLSLPKFTSPFTLMAPLVFRIWTVWAPAPVLVVMSAVSRAPVVSSTKILVRKVLSEIVPVVLL